MGLFDRIKVVNDPGYKAWRAAEEHWAEIVSIGAKLGPWTAIRLGIHFSGQPMTYENVRVMVPRGVEPHVGQHVNYKIRGDGQGAHYVIDWKTPPNYGGGEYDPQAAAESVIAEKLAEGGVATPAEATDPSYQLTILAGQRDRGEISDARFERDKADLLAHAADPQSENDPAVHRARLEARRAAGEVTDAEYAERTRDLDAWEANLGRLG